MVNTNSRASLVLLVLIIQIGLFACKRNKEDTTSYRKIDLSGIWDNSEKIYLSNIASDISYIPLETKPECLLGDILRISFTIHDNYIAVNSDGIKLFDRGGKFLCSIGQIGQGPKEYSGCDDYVLDEKKGRIDILDAVRNRIVSYSLRGDFIGDFSIKERSKVSITRDRFGRLGVFYLTPYEDIDNPTRIEWITETGEVIQSIPVYYNRPKGNGLYLGIFSNLYWSGAELLFNEIPFDTIFHLNEGQLWEPYWVIDVGSKKRPAEVCLDQSKLISEMDHHNFAKVIFEAGRYMFFTTMGIHGDGLAVYDKTDQKTLYNADESLLHGKSFMLMNDLDGGLPFPLKLINSDKPFKGNIIAMLSPQDLIAVVKNPNKSEVTIKSQKLRQNLLEMIRQLNDFDNPVVMMVKLAN